MQNWSLHSTAFQAGFKSPRLEEGRAVKGLILATLVVAFIGSFSSMPLFASVGFASGRTFDAGPNPDAVAVADFNGDGKPDLIIANDGGSGINGGPINGQVNVLLNQGNGSFVSVQSTVPNLTLVGVVAVADFNKDGKQDIVVSGINSAINSFQVAILLGGTKRGQPELRDFL